MNYEIIFLIPVFVFIVWASHKNANYTLEMERLAESVKPKFQLVEKDNLLYVVPIPQQGERQG